MSVSDSVAQEPRGLSAGQLVLIFLAGVAVCALFFSAGFLIGYNERLSKASPVTEQVTAPAEIPPLVTQPAPAQASPAAAPQATSTTEQPASALAEAPTTEVTHPEPLRPQPLSSSQPAKPAAPQVTKPAPTAKAPATTATTQPSQPSVASKANAPRGPESAAPEKAAAAPGGNLMIQVAATGNKHDADKIVAALRALEYSVIMVTPEQANAGDNLYRVQVGPFTTHDSAERIREKLIQDGFKSPFIKH